ncbi:ankyrin repeat-containing domain protein [Hypoxylon sp. FL1284]|nr:ankyrin repeat-containing domain protein [Hypoxylon sp. FL1284]
MDSILSQIKSEDLPKDMRNLLIPAPHVCMATRPFNVDAARSLVALGISVHEKVEVMGETTLTVALVTGTPDAVKWLFTENADISCEASLVYAAEFEHCDKAMVDEYFKYGKGFDINFVSDYGRTALLSAVSSGNAAVVESFLRHGADVNLPGPNHNTPVLAALACPNRIPFETILVLIEWGADMRKRGQKGRLPAHEAAYRGRLDVMRVLCSEKENVLARDDNGHSPLMYSVIGGRSPITRYLLSAGAYYLDEADEIGHTPLIAAAYSASIECLRELINSRFRKPRILNAQDFRGNTVLFHALRFSVLQTLIERGADPRIADCRGYSPLYWAIRLGYESAIDILVEAMEQLDENTEHHWNMAVHAAITSSNNGLLKELLERHDIDLRYPVPDGWTAMYSAHMYNSPRVKDILRRKAGVIYEGDLPSLRRPSRWHSRDKHPNIKIDPKKPTTLFTDSVDNPSHDMMGVSRHLLSTSLEGTVKADFPMLPLFNGRIYYFEVTIEALGYMSVTDSFHRSLDGFYVGFCDDTMPADSTLGCPGSWGFCSTHGYLTQPGMWKIEYYESYDDVGTTIGCGVNFAHGTAFFTRNGVMMGKAFAGISGKLYPALSMYLRGNGWRVSAVFPGEDGKSDDFVFKGNLEGQDTLLPPLLTPLPVPLPPPSFRSDWERVLEVILPVERVNVRVCSGLFFFFLADYLVSSSSMS